MRPNKVKAIFLKEIRELVRDKKTLFMIFGLPLIIYPLIMILVATIASRAVTSYSSKEYYVAVEASVTDNELLDYVTREVSDEDESVKFTIVDSEDYVQEINDGMIDLYLAYDEANNEYTINYSSSVTNSDHAYDYFSDRMEEFKQILVDRKFETTGVDRDEYLEPITIEREDQASDEEIVGNLLGMIVPLLLIMGVFIGTMTPAMDLTAGEKERGTQETLMTLPLSGTEIVTGKYLAVALFGVLSTLLYLVTIGVFVGFMVVYMDMGVTIDIAAFIPSAIMVVLSTIAFAAFLGAVIMCICSCAKSTKEASSYISPIMMVIMLIAYVGYLDVHLTFELSIVPVLNLVLLCKSVMNFEYNLQAIILVMASNVAYAAIAIAILGKLYTSEKILFGETSGSLFDRNTKREKGSTPMWTDTILVFAITMVLYLYLGQLMMVKLGIIGVGLNQIIIFGVPVLAAWYGKVDYKKTFSLNKLNILQIVSVLLIGIGFYFAGNIIMVPLRSILAESTQNFSTGMDELLTERGYFITWFVIGVTPAIGEETLFRGYALSALRSKFKPVWAIIISALFFGVFHMNLYQGTYAFLMGLVLAYIVYKTGSILAGTVIHLVANSITVVLNLFPETMEKYLPFLYADDPSIGLMLAIFAGALAIAVAGLGLLIKSSKN